MHIKNKPKFETNPDPGFSGNTLGATKLPVSLRRVWLAIRRVKTSVWLWITGTIITLILALVGGVLWWYQVQLQPVDTARTDRVLVKIESGLTPNDIADVLKQNNLIRNQTAFLWYTRFDGTQNFLQAGTYRLSPSESVPEIVDHLTKGTTETFNITFLPGATLAEDRKVLLKAGYSEQAVDSALGASYNSPLFNGKPASADLEGYIYGETYTFGVDASVQDILNYVFSTYYQVIKDNNLEAKFETHGLNLFQGITLASIIQREAGGGDEAQIAQVFYNRLSIGMVLGSDVTYQYIADKLGLERDPNLDSPYNTRRYAGLPPGPIAVPGLSALKAVAEPAQGDYLYFLSGDDNVTYFARTYAEHQQNINKHCQTKCQII